MAVANLLLLAGLSMEKAYPDDGAGRNDPPRSGIGSQSLLSDRSDIIEYMFEQATSAASSPEVIARFDELFERRYPSRTTESVAFLDRIGASWRAQNRAAASALAAIGELFGYRLARCSDTEDWAVDTEAAVSAEVAAALRISQGLAASQLRYARAMRERLPSWLKSSKPVTSTSGHSPRSSIAPI